MLLRHTFLVSLAALVTQLAQAAYTVNADGTVTDTTTGLVWDRCVLGRSTTTTACDTGSATIYSWANALAQVSARNTATHLGFNDWRLPNKSELESLVKIDVYNPAIDAAAFPNTPTNYSWTSTTGTRTPSEAWAVAFYLGSIQPLDKFVHGPVRLVRSGQSLASFSFVAPTTAPPTVVTVPAFSSAALSVTVSDTGTGYWLLVPAGSVAPTAAQVAAGAAYGSVMPAASGNLALTAGAAGTINVSGLAANTEFTLYFAARDANNNLQVSPSSVPVYTVGAMASLNDTGQTGCYNAADMAVACDAATAGNAGTRPHQDGRYGRDAAAVASQLTKTGGGAGGFDFTRLCWNGAAEGSAHCTGTLVANTTGTASGTPTTDWACTLDNVTGRVWSLQTQNATWATATGVSYPNAGHNSASRCGYATGWHLPNRRELLSLVHRGATTAPLVDATYLPATDATGNGYWSSDVARPEISANAAWKVRFDAGLAQPDGQSASYSTRLVRNVGTSVVDTTAPTKTSESLDNLDVVGNADGTMTFSENVTLVSARFITSGTHTLNSTSVSGNVVTFSFTVVGSGNSVIVEAVVRDAAGNEATVLSNEYHP